MVVALAIGGMIFLGAFIVALRLGLRESSLHNETKRKLWQAKGRLRAIEGRIQMLTSEIDLLKEERDEALKEAEKWQNKYLEQKKEIGKDK